MRSIDSIGAVFVNMVVGRGILNGVVNIQLGTYQFTPDDSGGVDPDPAVSVRLRMDRACAKQLHDTLGQLLDAVTKIETEVVSGAAPPVDDPVQGKPN